VSVLRCAPRWAVSAVSATALLISGALALPASALGTPTASFTWSPTSPQVGETVEFDASASTPGVPLGTISSYGWDWNGDDTVDQTTTDPTALHSFATKGQVTVKLTVTDTGATNTTSHVILIGDKAPTASFTAPASANVDAAAALDGTGSSDPDAGDTLTYAWDYTNDGTVDATTATAQASYHQAGAYTIKLTVTDSAGVSHAVTKAITISNTAPTVTFTVTPGSPHASQVVTFDGSGSGDAESPKSTLTYAWDFGDGSTATGNQAQAEVVTHTYSSSGSKTVTLTITDPQAVAGTSSKSVSVGANGAPTVVLSADHDHAHPAQAVTFDGTGSSDVETPANLTYEWDFGDGSPLVTGTKAAVGSVQHQFATGDAQYTVSLKVTDGGGASTSDTVDVIVGAFAPVAAYTVDHSPANVDQLVTFDGSGSSDPEGSALTYAWSYTFGGSAPIDLGTTASVQHTFTTVGTYAVSLRVTDADDNYTTTLTKNLSVQNTAPTASATASPSQPWQAAPVAFDASASSDVESAASALTYAWDFDGDGTADATGVTAQHAFASSGPMTVTLSVTDPQGLTGTKNLNLFVQPNGAPTADLGTPTPNPAHNGQTVAFDGSGSSDPDIITGDSVASYSWDFGDGSALATTDTAEHAYADAGVYDVVLTVTDEHGATDTATTQVTVTNAAPTAVATAPSSALVDHQVTFDGTGSSDPDGDGLTYLWEFPDSSTATTATVAKTFHTGGSYEAKLTVTDPYGESTYDTVTVNVTNTAPTAGATLSPGSVLVGHAISFAGSGSDAETPGGLSFAWTFGDGTTASTKNASHTYSSPGIYHATLTVTDPQGLQAVVSKTARVSKLVPCLSPTMSRTGSWRGVKSTAAKGGSYCDNLGTASGKDTLSLAFTGPQLGVYYARSTKGGQASVYVDGVQKGVIDFHSAATTPSFGGRLVIHGLGSGSHTVRIVVTSGAAYVDDLEVWGPLG
jgi:PKD repeat protein